MRKTIKVTEIVVIVLLVAACIGAWFFFNRNNGNDRIAKIYHDGQLVQEINLSKHTGTDTISIASSAPVTIQVHDQTIGFVDANCPDKLCEHVGFIERPTQTAVCLPLKVAIVIEQSGKPDDVDIVAG